MGVSAFGLSTASKDMWNLSYFLSRAWGKKIYTYKNQ
jgi:hypothetical protein